MTTFELHPSECGGNSASPRTINTLLRVTVHGVLSSACLAMMTTPTHAAETETASATGTTSPRLEEVEVTASRVSRAGFEAPTPTTMLSVEVFERAAVTNIADQINKLPSLRATATPATTTISTTNAGSNFLDLRGLGNVRTLVLVNKRRHVPSNPEGRVDINVIPAALIERVDIVTGGASAAWGSDAMAGVVNVITDNDLQGLRATIQGGLAEHGEGEDFLASLAAGTDFAGGRGHVVVGLEYNKSNGVEDPESRDWFGRHHLQIANPSYAPNTGQPQILVVPHVTASNAAAGGLINAGPLRGTEFLPNGQTRQFGYGDNVGASFMTNGDGVYTPALQWMVTPVERYSLFVSGSFDLTDNVSAFVEAGTAHASTEYAIPFFTGTDFATPIRVDNAYLPESVRAQMEALGLASFTMGRASDDIPYNLTDNGNEVYRIAAGLSGTLAGDWRWNAYGQFGKNDSIADIHRVRINARYLQAVDAVRDPVTDQIMCRSTLTNPSNGCVPINLFGEGTPDVSASDWFTVTRDVTRTLEQTAFGAEIGGDPFSTWAGPVSVAAGVEYRRDSVDQVVSPEAEAGLLNLGNTKPYSGASSVREGFLEAVVPLVTEQPMFQSLEFNGAVRLTDYDNSGSVTTWKAGLSWAPNSSVRIRAAQSRDIRAPNLAELKTGLSLSFATIFDPFTGTQVQNVRAPSVGNPDLDPELGDTTTVGVVFTPRSVPNLTASIDWYDIDIEDAIGTVGPQSIVNFCYQGEQQFCDAITRDEAGALVEVRNTWFNLAAFATRGVDAEVSYALPLEQLGSASEGTLVFRLLATYVDKFINDNGTRVLDLTESVGSFSGNGGPQWRAAATVDYLNGPIGLQVEGRYVGSGVLEPTVTYSDESVDSWTVLNVAGSYRLPYWTEDTVEVFGKIQNLLDEEPPVAPSTTFPTERRIYDVLGRFYSVGVRVRF